MRVTRIIARSRIIGTVSQETPFGSAMLLLGDLVTETWM